MSAKTYAALILSGLVLILAVLAGVSAWAAQALPFNWWGGPLAIVFAVVAATCTFYAVCSAWSWDEISSKLAEPRP